MWPQFNKMLFFYIISVFLQAKICDNLMQHDNKKIDLNDDGYKSVNLKCSSNHMHISLETVDDFVGVIYTRGSFHDKKPPCFLDPGYKRGQRSFSLKFDFDKCKTLKKGSIFSNVLIVQNDKDLIMPGDAAFNLECDFNNPRDVIVNANLNNQPQTVISRISLTDANRNAEPRSKRSNAENYNNTIILTPNLIVLES